MKEINITEFAKRHFKKDFAGTRITNNTPEEFIERLDFLKNINVDDYQRSMFFPEKILYWKRKGDFEFSRLVTIMNFTNAKLSTMPITLDNVQYLRTDYFARSENELPVLSRFFELPSPIKKPEAENLTIVLYSKEQIDKEGFANEGEKYIPFDAEWGIVSLMAHNGFNVEPILPMTMLRNALGIEEGGNGTPIDKIKYKESVDFWSKHAIIK